MGGVYILVSRPLLGSSCIMLMTTLLTTLAAGALGIVPSLKHLSPKFLPQTLSKSKSTPIKTHITPSTKQSIPVSKSQDVMITQANRHLIPHNNQIVSFSTKPVATTTTTRDPAKLPDYDYAEPDEIRRRLEAASKINSTQLVTESKHPATEALSLNTFDGRRKWNHLETKHPKYISRKSWGEKHDHIKRRQFTRKLKTQNQNRSMYHTAGLTKPSQYEIKRYRKPRISGRRHHHKHHKHERQYKKQKKHRFRSNDLIGHEINRKEKLPVKSKEIDLPPDVEAALQIQQITTTKEATTLKRVHIHPKKGPTKRLATRPSLYEITYPSTTAHTVDLMLWTGESTKPEQEDASSSAQKLHAGRKRASLSSDSDSEPQFSAQKKKVERFVKYLNKNRNVLKGMGKDKDEWQPGRKGEDSESELPEPKQSESSSEREVKAHLDLSPGKSFKIEIMRRHGRICQRNVMIPEGPKYNSQGQIYMPAFKKVEGAPDYPNTKEPKFIIPACCNCCKKSVLGCQ